MSKLHIPIFLLCFLLFTIGGGAGRSESQVDFLSRIDHLVYATPELNRGIDEIEALLGIRATPGGEHPGRGTRNALVSLGPATYLEIIGPDPQQPAPSTPRSFGLDGLKKSALVAWAAKGSDLEKFVRTAAGKEIRLGGVTGGSRRRPDGVLLSWQYTDPRTVVADGIVPFFIDWGKSPHPAQTAAKGATLIGLRADHPDAQRVHRLIRDLDLELPVQAGQKPGLVATIEGRRGRVELR